MREDKIYPARPRKKANAGVANQVAGEVLATGEKKAAANYRKRVAADKSEAELKKFKAKTAKADKSASVAVKKAVVKARKQGVAKVAKKKAKKKAGK